jgi:hypothetical protein
VTTVRPGPRSIPRILANRALAHGSVFRFAGMRESDARSSDGNPVPSVSRSPFPASHICSAAEAFTEILTGLTEAGRKIDKHGVKVPLSARRHDATIPSNHHPWGRDAHAGKRAWRRASKERVPRSLARMASCHRVSLAS